MRSPLVLSKTHAIDKSWFKNSYNLALAELPFWGSEGAPSPQFCFSANSFWVIIFGVYIRFFSAFDVLFVNLVLQKCRVSRMSGGGPNSALEEFWQFLNRLQARYNCSSYDGWVPGKLFVLFNFRYSVTCQAILTYSKSV